MTRRIPLRKCLALALALACLIGLSAPALAEGDQPLRTVRLFGYDYKHHDWMTANVGVEKYYAVQVLFADLAERGLQLEWETVPNDSYEMVLQTRMASGENIGTLINCNTMSQADVLRYGEQGYFIDLLAAINEYDEDGSILAFCDKYFPGKLDLYTTADGMLYWWPYMYATPTIEGVEHNGSVWVSKIRLDWLEKIGVEYKYEYSTDELFDILLAFRTQDVNENGMEDEVIGVPLNSFANYSTAGLGNAFGLYAGAFTSSLGYGVEWLDGTKEWGVVWESEYIKEYLTYLNELYEAGIYDVDLLNEGADVQMRNENRGAMCYDYATSVWEEEEVLGVPEAFYAPIRVYYEDPANSTVQSQGINGSGSVHMYCVPAYCTDEEIEAVIDLLDYICTEKYPMLVWSGVEGEGFHYDEYGVVVRDYDELMPKDQENLNAPLAHSITENLLPNMALSFTSIQGLEEKDYPKWVEENDIKRIFNYEFCYGPFAGTYNIVRENLAFAVATAEEIEVIERVENTLITYSEEMLVEYVLGERSIDDLDKYIAEMYDLGLGEYKEVMQARYDRAWNK